MTLRICRACKTEKPLDAYTPNKAFAAGRVWTCRECQRVTGRANYAKNREHILSRKLAAFKRRRAELDALKSVPCMDCRLTFPPCCMDFDHRDPSLKEFQVSYGVGTGKSATKVAAEIAKCDIVCANCHRVRTAARRRS